MNSVTTTRQAPATSQPERRTGVAMVPGALCQYGADVGPNDVLLADFDQHHVTADGLYLLERTSGGAVTWMGCRRIAKAATGGVLVDQSGRGDWISMEGLEGFGLRVAGRVQRVLN